MNRIVHVASVALGFIVLGCTGGRNPEAVSAHTADIPWSHPEDVGMHAARLAEMRTALQERVDSGEVAGAVVALARRGALVYRDSVGFADLDMRLPLRTDALFRIGSMTKPVTSVGVMMLVDDGLITLDDPVSRYLPGFRNPRVLVVAQQDSSITTVPAQREITIRDLLTHRSGITYGFYDDGPVADLYREHGVADGIGPTSISLAENVRRLAAQPLRFQPGSEHWYGLNVDLLGRLVEVVAGTPFATFLEQRLFAPLGMNDTHFHVPDDKLARLATPYQWTRARGLQVMADSAWIGNLLIGGRGYHGSAVYHSGGAGLISTADDYLRFLQMLLGNGTLDGARILRPETVALMTRSHTDDLATTQLGPGAGMGLGFVVTTAPQSGDPGSAGSYTQPGIYGTTFWVDPKEELIGIVMVQRYPIGASLTIDDVFRMLAYRALRD